MKRDSIPPQWRWKAFSTAIGLLCGLVAKRLLRGTYRAVRRGDPDEAFDPTAPLFSWPNAAVWAIAAGIGLVTAKMVGDRVAAIGWEAATGARPPTSLSDRIAG